MRKIAPGSRSADRRGRGSPLRLASRPQAVPESWFGQLLLDRLEGIHRPLASGTWGHSRPMPPHTRLWTLLFGRPHRWNRAALAGHARPCPVTGAGPFTSSTSRLSLRLSFCLSCDFVSLSPIDGRITASFTIAKARLRHCCGSHSERPPAAGQKQRPHLRIYPPRS
ncbi:hypothetical protein HDV57DRAFT_466249 [Trichoderma longibrachiatum]|uniref:Uncharacterized protein n=1 Tax=Trichoderma longibrachiatum ATCC 18648 TaxID=983965 RepID=A0A2T4C5K9_TRILO|nr:hypothetical protein M440DRAFT_304818 [Trichoderma longibrachiatum ATCC 18648]